MEDKLCKFIFTYVYHPENASAISIKKTEKLRRAISFVLSARIDINRYSIRLLNRLCRGHRNMTVAASLARNIAPYLLAINYS